ncbi:hypothetical protein M5K25_026948 [Dendrobium thyrsiflorum]|uniref:Uncharacterized protein n=1 Tax=Dendrobium thyrsiflorum TaxID=117978 RepID=A0ABD0TYW2_DENTH
MQRSPLLGERGGKGRGKRGNGGGMDDGPNQDPMVPSSRAIVVPVFGLCGNFGCLGGIRKYLELTPPVEIYVQRDHHRGPSLFRQNFGSLPASLPFRGKLREIGHPATLEKNVYDKGQIHVHSKAMLKDVLSDLSRESRINAGVRQALKEVGKEEVSSLVESSWTVVVLTLSLDSREAGEAVGLLVNGARYRNVDDASDMLAKSVRRLEVVWATTRANFLDLRLVVLGFVPPPRLIPIYYKRYVF